MTHIAIVTTTINHPIEVFAELARAGQLIVAGDMKTPYETAELVKELGGLYLHPSDQERWKISDMIGWNTIQRRNVAFLEAARAGAEVIITVDDDNLPVTDLVHDGAVWWADEHVKALQRRPMTLASTNSRWFNPGSLLFPPVWARGLPYTDETMEPAVTDIANRDAVDAVDAYVGVNCGLWIGDPDVDAMQRITRRPTTLHLRDEAVIAPGTWAPINSQNTAWRRELLPLAVVLPFVGRWDDIFGGYLAQWSMWAAGCAVSYGEPLVRQDRNEHNLWRDLDLETTWLAATPKWCNLLEQLTASGYPLMDLTLWADTLSNETNRQTWIDVADFLYAWVDDCHSLGWS